MSTEPPKVLVLLATYNGVAWLEEQLRSIVGQRGVRVSILVNDDGSSDGTPRFVTDWAARESADLRLLPPAAQRLGAAGNFLRLIREAPLDDVDAVALADQDDIWQLDRLVRAVDALRTKGLAGYSSDVEAFWADGRRRRLGKACPQRAMDHLFEPAGPGCTYVLSRELALALQVEVRHEPERFVGIGYHDWLIYAFARSHGYRWLIDPSPGVAYRQHGHNELGANLGAMAIPKRWRRLTSGWFRQQVLQIARLWPGGEADAVVEHLQRLGLRDRLWLAAHARRLRRRPTEQAALVVMLLLGVLR